LGFEKDMLFMMKTDRSLQAVGFEQFLLDGMLRNYNNFMVWRVDYNGTSPTMYAMLVEAAALGCEDKFLQHYMTKCNADWFKAAVFMMVHFGHLHLINGSWYASAIAEPANGLIGVHENWLLAMADLCLKLGWKREKAVPQKQDFITLLRERGRANFNA
jgi:hypothetical protein